MEKIKVVELFAGVGGFQLALKKASPQFEFIFSNQWEPGKSPQSQYAFKALIKNFGHHENEIFSNEDIATAKYQIPDDFDLLVGGFPCQDYSVAATKARGIEGKKGVLWWDISWILEHKKPKMVLLENVDRLLKSPSVQRGKDFAIILKNFARFGYSLEWRVINAAEYGFAQRRRRVFIFAVRNDFKTLNFNFQIKDEDFLYDFLTNSIFAEKFSLIKNEYQIKTVNLKKYANETTITQKYNEGKFLTAGFMKNGIVKSFDYQPLSNNDNPILLKDILEKNVSSHYFLTSEQIEKIKYLKGAKKYQRTKKDGSTYMYSEGSMSIFDDINKPARTMLTSESSIGRTSHFINEGSLKKEKVRKITPIEAEKINGFPTNWTADVMPEKMRYFCMGNALVVPLVENLGYSILDFAFKK